jgi:cell filamentation protein
MVDKYGTTDDPTCYPGTDVLINLLDIRDLQRLEQAEYEITSLKAASIDFSPPPYDLDYLCGIHRALFGEVYPWAGQLRTLDISKGGTRFCNVSRKVPESRKLFARLAQLNCLESITKAELIPLVAELYGEINMLHPFRDGNGRAQRILFEHLVINVGYEISWQNTDREEWLQANKASVNCDYDLLKQIFTRCIGSEIQA